MMQIEQQEEQGLAYVALPGEIIKISDMSNQANISSVKTSRRDFDIIKDSSLQLRCRHAGWIWKQQKEQKELRIALFGGQFQYYPELDDYIIVTIQSKSSENYFCSKDNIGSSYILNSLDFEGATKKNKPNLVVGSLVYARVIELSGYLRGRLSCVNPKSKKEWTTGESLFGELVGGVCINVPISFTELLLSKQKKPQFFKELAKFSSFEVCIGRNGKIWIKNDNDDHMILIYNLIVKASKISEEDQQLALIKQCGQLFK